MITGKSLKLHMKLAGKLETKSKIRITSRSILSEIYTPGVAECVRAITLNSKNVFALTIKHNTVAVISDGSAVLGMGNVGAEAALPVMEGKCILFKELAGLNAFPICLATQDSGEIINIVRNISPVFAAINLEDISAPKCFEIESKLQNMPIPVVHDDQQATAIIVLAGLINAVKIYKKDLKQSRIVVCGAGAAGYGITKLLHYFGCRNMTAVDSKGIICILRKDLNAYKKELAGITSKENKPGKLKEAVRGSDILIGVSRKNLFTKEMLRTMNDKAVVFALANPDPEISRNEAAAAGVFIYANGRSDDPNQINNALVFPGFFKGLINNKIKRVNEGIKVKTALAIASLVKNPVQNKFIPDIFDPGLVKTISESLSD